MNEKYPKLRDDLIISRQVQAGQTVYIVKDPVTNRFFRLRDPEYFLASSLDGKTSSDTILQNFREHFGIDIKAEQLDAFVKALGNKNFLETFQAEYEVSRPIAYETEQSFLARILYIKLKAFDPANFLEWLYGKFRFLLSPPVVVISLIITVAGFLQAIAISSEMPHTVYQIFRLSSIPVIIIAVFVVVALHELAHAMVCRHFGGKVHEMGFLLLYFQVCFYCNLSDSYLFEKKSQRILTILAGIYMQAFIGAVSIILWRVLKTGNFFSDILFLTASIAFVTLLFNLNPLLKLDGYYLLTDIAEIPNLRQKAFGYLKSLLKSTFVKPDNYRYRFSRHERRVFMIYSLLAILYSAILFYWVGGMVYRMLVGNWGGFGFILFLLLVVIIFNEPLRKLIKLPARTFSRQGVSMPKSKRFYIWLTVFAALIALAFLFPVSLKINAPVTIEPLEKFIIKGGSNSQLETNWFKGGIYQKPINRVYQFSISDFAVLDIKPTLSAGAEVDSGEILLEISSNHFQSQLDQTNAEIDQAKAEYGLLLSDPKTAELARAKASLDEETLRQINVEQEYQRAKKMHDKNVISEEEWEGAKTARYVQNKKVDIAQSEFDLLKAGPKSEELLKQDAEIKRLQAKAKYLEEQIAACTIRAPFSGKLTLFGIPGELISLAQTDSMEVNIRVPEDQIDILQVGQEMTFRVAGYPRKSFYGKIDKVITVAHNSAKSNHFIAISTVPNSSELLKGGMDGYAKIYCGKTSVAKNVGRKLIRFFRVEFWSWW
jgi:putative peptide zinc metalloprotease protein